MLDSANIVAFGATADPGRSIRFYRDVLKLRLVEDAPYALIFDANGTTLRIQKVDEVVPVPYTMLGWSVDDMETTHRLLADEGISLERFANLGQDENGVVEFPEGAKVAWFRDPDGNLISITQLP